jgi:hypothetical protein
MISFINSLFLFWLSSPAKSGSHNIAESDVSIQFCQSQRTNISRYIGPIQDESVLIMWHQKINNGNLPLWITVELHTFKKRSEISLDIGLVLSVFIVTLSYIVTTRFSWRGKQFIWYCFFRVINGTCTFQERARVAEGERTLTSDHHSETKALNGFREAFSANILPIFRILFSLHTNI